jgi:hypothetical protein
MGTEGTRREATTASQLYKIARTANTLVAVASGNPRRIARRAKNIAVGRSLAKSRLLAVVV